MSYGLLATDADSRVTNWHTFNWTRANRYVRKLQARIVKAVKQGKWRRVKNLQRLLNHSVSGRLLAVR
ncbi:MAG: reverse transcriptase N-terminal domain-containing protein [Methylococcales bacterium]|nr:reverse transcriptase N-terminal domain-containing protein [Methylococcales bacterium]